MTRQSEHQAKRAREGYRKVQFLATPETVAALARLRARGAKSDAAAVNAAVVAYAQTAETLKHTNAVMFSDEEATRG